MTHPRHLYKHACASQTAIEGGYIAPGTLAPARITKNVTGRQIEKATCLIPTCLPDTTAMNSSPHKVFGWLNFDASPLLGQPGPDFPLWDLDGRETALSAIWSTNTYSVVEFGSFT